MFHRVEKPLLALRRAGDHPSPSPGLEVRGLVKRFGGVAALDGVDLTVGPGEALAVIGPNGAGKSTLLKLIAGIHRPDRGQVQLNGVRLDRMPQHRVVHSGAALAHQIPRPFAGLTVRQNVRVAATAGRGASRQGLVDEVLEECGLVAKAEFPAGGLQVLDLKRLEVARALATGPTVLMLDEVAAGLVGRELDEAIELIRRLRSDGRTLILVEHIERVVREVVDRVVVLDWGRTLAEGTPAEVAQDPKVRAVYLGESSSGAAAPVPARASVSGQPLLSIESVDAGYGQMLALRGVSLQIQPGEVIAVLGANGAGKSTLCGAIAGAVRVRSGTVHAFGRDITELATHHRARLGIGYCQEGRRVFADLTVAENLTLGAGLGVPRVRLAERLERVHETFPMLAERATQRAGTLSGGQQQMLAIGRALMADPKLLLCDEISLGLAPVAVDALYDALRRIVGQGVAILLVEQSAHRCLDLAARAYVLMRGRISYAGDPRALLSSSLLDAAYFGTDESPLPRPEPA